MDTRPYYRRTTPTPQAFNSFLESNRIDLRFAHLPPYPTPDHSGAWPDMRGPANALFDARAAAAVSATVGDPAAVRIRARLGFTLDPQALLEDKIYFQVAPSVAICTSKMLAAMAYADYFPDGPRSDVIRGMVSDALMEAGPGWCGSFGPDVDAQGRANFDGNYDFAQMFILPLIYGFYDDLTPAAREKAITVLLAKGRIHRANLDDTFTSGPAPNDWSRAGFGGVLGINAADIPETENHVLMIATARYLTNQLLYQRTHDPQFDNRRNGNPHDSQPATRCLTCCAMNCGTTSPSTTRKTIKKKHVTRC
jgi:hypothetical protein